MNRYVWPVICLVLATGVQGSLPRAISIFGAMPDLALAVLIAFALAEDPAFGATLGFIAGLIQGCSLGMGLGSFVVTRTITGFVAGLVSTRLFSQNTIVPTLSAAWLTALAGGLYQLFNPRLPVTAAICTVAGQSIQNAIFTFLISFILHTLDTRRKNKIINARF